MKYINDIEYIRSLLDRYYRADTTPDEERTIESFFHDTDPTEIPDDMITDARLFSLMKETHPILSESDIPDSLLEKINGILEEPTSPPAHKRRKMIFRILRYSGVAVAACIGMAIITLKPFGQHQETNPTISSRTETLITDDHSYEAMISDVRVLTIVKSRIESHASEEKPTGKVGAPTHTHKKATDGFIEITDPEEARKIALSIGKLLAQNADRTNDALAQIGNSIDSYKDLTKSILQ